MKLKSKLMRLPWLSSLLLASSITVTAQTICIDKAESSIKFVISHLGVLKVSGKFTDFEGCLTKSNRDWTIDGTIQVASVATENQERDKTILERQYLNAKEFATIVFIGSGNETAEGKIEVDGKLRLRGVTKPIRFILLRTGSNFNASKVTISRQYFGLDFGSMDALIGDEIEISLTLTGH